MKFNFKKMHLNNRKMKNNPRSPDGVRDYIQLIGRYLFTINMTALPE